MVRHSLAILKIDNICYPLGHMEVSPACSLYMVAQWRCAETGSRTAHAVWRLDINSDTSDIGPL